jgi:hypothetical protein
MRYACGSGRQLLPAITIVIMNNISTVAKHTNVNLRFTFLVEIEEGSRSKQHVKSRTKSGKDSHLALPLELVFFAFFCLFSNCM